MSFNDKLFQSSYKMAMAERAPKMMGELKEAKILDEHLEQITLEAGNMFEEIVTNLKANNGNHGKADDMMAMEIVNHEMIQFPKNDTEEESTDLLSLLYK